MQVVAIGASAGGIEAFRLFFGAMPPDSGLSFVVVLHLSADRKSMLADIIGRWTTMVVREAVDHERLAANVVHVIPPGMIATVKAGMLQLRRLAPDVPREPTPIDTFFDSLALDMGAEVIGIVLSGTGHDGALGLKAIKACHGLTLAQGSDGSSPQHTGMPSAAIAVGAVDAVVSVEDMPARIMAMRTAPTLGERSQDATRGLRLRLCEMLHARTGHDFTNYKDNTFLRRVGRRMQVLGIATLGEYVARFEAEENKDRQRDEASGEAGGEARLLFRDLLIGVTTFFRDPAAFEAVRSLVMPRLFAGKGPGHTVRVWVAGCATGEEAYSLAILLREQMDGLAPPPRVQIFATDIDETAIATARAGRYPASLMDGMSAGRLARFFTRGESSYLVTKEIRDLVTFSAHSLIRDPPFSRLDMMSCRNLLIYMDADLQASIIPAFHYALLPGGILLLGSSETVVRHDGLFAPLDKERRIFIRRDGPSGPLRLSSAPGRSAALPTTHAAPPRLEHGMNWTGVIATGNARVLERFASPFALVMADGTLIHYSSHKGHFLLPALGAPSRNVFDMARRDIRLTLRSALRQAVETGRRVELAVSSGFDGATFGTTDGAAGGAVTLIVEPLPGQEPDRPYLVVFQTDKAGVARPELPAEVSGVVAQYEREVRDTREQLQSLSEEHQTALEELRSANEELHSVNEELQSTNEELETSKEEIQSVNEELQTVNAQLSGKVDELNRANSDLRNLFESTRVATVFLDHGMIIRAFTPEVCSIYNLIPSDRGRPLADIVSRLDYDGLRGDMLLVLESLEPLERRVSRRDGSAHYLLRILPYRAPDSTVDGTLVTFVDVTSIVQAEQHHRLLVDELNHRVKDMLAVVVSLATETLKDSGTVEAFRGVFLGRVQALISAYALLSEETWSHVSLRDMIMGQLLPVVTDIGAILLEGPDVALDPRGALSLGMAIHELAKNAVAYGALSVAGGRVAVTWAADDSGDAGDGAMLRLQWAELHGPAVVEPVLLGFGTALIERGIADGLAERAQVHFEPAGVRAEIAVALRGGVRSPPGHA